MASRARVKVATEILPPGGIDDRPGLDAPSSLDFEQDEAHRPPKLRGRHRGCPESVVDKVVGMRR